MKPYDTYILLYTIKTLLESGNNDKAMELIDKIINLIEDKEP